MEVVAEINDAGGQAAAHFGSVANFADAKDIVGTAIAKFGRLDVVVNNAGVLRDVIFHKMEEEDWDSVINVHLKGSFNVSRAGRDGVSRAEVGVFCAYDLYIRAGWKFWPSKLCRRKVRDCWFGQINCIGYGTL
ncbi:MAG: hypothetical protein CM1200mP4_1840 [Rhodospirillaceae bacterium]|nr:MAG: hypothetical protein CM1200mP4_1840 [Rhodospirillaceae bacterium]